MCARGTPSRRRCGPLHAGHPQAPNCRRLSAGDDAADLGSWPSPNRPSTTASRYPRCAVHPGPSPARRPDRQEAAHAGRARLPPASRPRGVRCAHLPDSLALRTEVLRLVLPPGCFACDETAAWLHGADMALAPNSHLALPQVSFFRPADEGRLRNPLATSGERTVTPCDLTDVGGLLVTTPLRTALDLGRLRRRDQALSALDAFLHLGLVTARGAARLARPLRGAARASSSCAGSSRSPTGVPSRRVSRHYGCAGTTRACHSRSCRSPSSATASRCSGSTSASRSCGSPRSTTASTSTRRSGSADGTTAAAPCSASACTGSSRSSTTHQRVRAPAGRLHPAAERLPERAVEPG